MLSKCHGDAGFLLPPGFSAAEDNFLILLLMVVVG